jgi:hypothetical protein
MLFGRKSENLSMQLELQLEEMEANHAAPRRFQHEVLSVMDAGAAKPVRRP